MGRATTIGTTSSWASLIQVPSSESAFDFEPAAWRPSGLASARQTYVVDYRIMETAVSEMSHFPVRLMSFLHTPFKIKCKYAVFTAIVTKERRPDAIRNATI